MAPLPASSRPRRKACTLTGVELQTQKYSEGVPAHVPAPRRPLPFLYQSTGIETRFTNLLEPDARSRNVFAFHRPDTLADWLTRELHHPGSTPRAKLRHLPELITDGLRPAQIKAIRKLEMSLTEQRPRALIQMASGGGKTYTACNFTYRLIKHAGAHRILFLVDRGNLGRQTLKEFQAFVTPEENRPFTELYNVQLMRSNKLDDVSHVCITTIQRLFSMLKGEENLIPRSKKNRPSPWLGFNAIPSRSRTTRSFPSRRSTSSSPTSATGRSTTCGGRCWSTSTPLSSASRRRPQSRPSASSIRIWLWSTATSRPWPTTSTSTSTSTASAR